MNYISLFSGIGGFEYGIQSSNKADKLQCVGYSEIDKYAETIYKKHYPNHPGLGDATKINTENIPKIDLLVGGFPCQAFSVAGKRRGFDDTRGTLFFEISRILKDKKPKYFLLENVKGLLSHDKGRTFQTILGTLAELGYDVQWEIFNSKNHGVPQNRERIYIKGFLRERCGREVLSLRKAGAEVDARQGENTESDSNIRIKSINGSQPQGYGIYDTEGISPTLTCNHADVKIQNKMIRLDKERCGREVLSLRKEGTTVDARQGKGYQKHRKHLPSGGQQGNVYDEEKQGSHLLKESECVTLDNTCCRIRRLTPVECERLQGFPDDWTKYGADGELISDTQRYKCCGNAVTTNVVRDIMNTWDMKIKEED